MSGDAGRLLDNVRDGLRHTPATVAPTVGLIFAGTWGGQHHFVMPVEPEPESEGP